MYWYRSTRIFPGGPLSPFPPRSQPKPPTPNRYATASAAGSGSPAAGKAAGHPELSFSKSSPFLVRFYLKRGVFLLFHRYHHNNSTLSDRLRGGGRAWSRGAGGVLRKGRACFKRTPTENA